MSDGEMSKPATRSGEVRLLDLAAILLQRWRLLAACVLAAVTLAVVVLLLLPDRYVARTVLVPAQQKAGSPSAQLLARLPGAIPSLGSMGSDPQQQLIESILHSRSLAELIAQRIEVASPGAASASEVQDLVRTADIQGQIGEGAIAVQITAPSGELAARVANEFPAAVNEIATQLGTQLAVQRQRFLESQITTASEQLARSEAAILNFQRTREVPAGEAQAEKTLELAAGVQQAIITKELEVAQLRRVGTPDNPELQRAQAELGSLRGQMQRLSSGGGTRGQLVIPLQQSPELKVQATRLLRELNKNEQVFLSLTAALADAQIEAHNSLPVVAVLDPATTPDGPAGRGAPLFVAVAVLAGLLVGCWWAFTAEFAQRLRQDPANERLVSAWEHAKRGATPPFLRRRLVVSGRSGNGAA